MNDDLHPAADGREPAVDPPWPPRPEGWRHDAPDPPDAFRVPFRVWDALVLQVLSIVVLILVGGILAAALSGGDIGALTAETNLAITIVIYLLVLGVVLGWLARQGRLNWRLLGPVRPRLRHVGTGVLVGLAGFVLVVATVTMILALAGVEEVAEQGVLDDIRQSGLAVVLGIVTVGICAPVVEETLHRGVLFQSLKARLGLFPGMFLSAGVFALSHLELLTINFEPVLLFGLFVFAVWLAGAMHRTGTLVVPVVAHATFNLIQLALALTVQADAAPAALIGVLNP